MAPPKVSLIKKSSAPSKMRSPVQASASGPALDFVFQDNEDSTCTVLGVNASGNTVDISSVATISVTSDNASIVTVDPPAGMQFAMHAVGPVTPPGAPVNIAVTATWNDGSKGPFNFTLPVTVVPGPVTGVVIVPGTPTSH